MSTIIAPVAERREPSGASDGDLVAAARGGDDRAFELLYGRYHRRIAAYVYGMVNDYGRAEDITQEVFISALRRMRETDRPIAFKPWIYEIAKNACIDQFRRARRAEEISFDADEQAGGAESVRLASVEGGPDEIVSAKQQLDDLCGAFGGLSDTHHQILVMRELEGLSYREIGEKMGLSRPSVESTLFRARRRLTEEYDELVSGERCLRVQSIIVTAADGLGARDQKRMLRHVAHCQPCRREARLAGVEVGVLSRHPVRDAVAAKVAAFLPFPFLFRRRGSGGAESTSGGLAGGLGNSLPGMAEPLAGWGKAAFAALTLLVAGAGAGAVTSVVADDDPVPAASKSEAAGTKTAKEAAAREAAAEDRAAARSQARTQRRAAARAERRAARRERPGGSRNAPAGSAEPQPSGGGAAEQPAGVLPNVPSTPVIPQGRLELNSDGATGGSILPPEVRAPADPGGLVDQLEDAAGAVPQLPVPTVDVPGVPGVRG